MPARDSRFGSATVRCETFGEMPDGRRVDCFSLTSKSGLAARVLTLGATLNALFVPDIEGRLANVTLGCSGVGDYLAQRAYLGSIVGRYANRIANGSFQLDGVLYRLPRNEPPNTLHGGTDGFDRRLWRAIACESGARAGVVLELRSLDGDQGFPGTLTVRVHYVLIGDELHITTRARTDQPTVVNLTSHAYWNLAGEGAGTVDDHVVWLNAHSYTPVDEQLIPTGEIAAVAGTPLDFRTAPDTIGHRINSQHEQLRHASGYDHNFVLDAPLDNGGRPLAARVFEPHSRRRLDLLTTSPGLQFYSGNQLDGSIVGTSGVAYQRRDGFALEAQLFPDAPNRPHFPDCVLRPGAELHATTVYRFGVQVADGVR